MSTIFDVTEIQGVEELRAKFADLNSVQLANKVGRYTMEPAASLGVKTAVTAVDGGRNIAIRSINKDVQAMTARVYTAMPLTRAMSIEEGRPPGEWVSSKAIRLWANSVGMSQPFAAKYEIHARGVKGKRFMGKAHDAIENAIPGYITELEGVIEEDFNK